MIGLSRDYDRAWAWAEIKRLEGHLVDALAHTGDEGRGTLR